MTFQIEQFPDGEYEVSLTREEGGPEIGRAIVVFKDGLFNSTLTFDDKLADDLDLRFSFYRVSDPLGVENDKINLVVKRADEEF